MNWEVYSTPHSGVGTLCEVYVDKAEQLIKRYFHENAKTVAGTYTRFAPSEINQFFENEVYWLGRLKGDWLPELIEINTKDKYIVQKFYGDCLLDTKYRLKQDIPDIVEQVLELHRYFRSEGVFKRNGSLSNLTQRAGRIVAFDFKWATHRPEGLEKELYSYDNYFVKIDPSLPQLLKELL